MWCEREPHSIIASEIGASRDLRSALRSSSFQPVTHQTIVVLDFGSQFTQLIARRLRELSIYSEILPFDTSPAEIARRRPVGIILSGGPKSVSEPGAPRCERAVLESGVPVLGICYGMQLMTDLMGGEVAPAPHREFGLATIRIEPGAPLFALGPRRAARLGQPRRFRRGGAAGLRRHRDERQRAGGGDGRPGAGTLRAPVPPRGRAHRSRARHPPEFRLRRLRLHRRLDDGVVCRGSDRADPRAGRRRARGVRAERRRGFDGRRAAHPPRHRRSPDLHLRRQRRDASRRGRPDSPPLRTSAAAARVRRRRPIVPRPPRRRHRPRAQAEDHRRDVHRRLRSGSGEARHVRLPRRRARSIRT